MRTYKISDLWLLLKEYKLEGISNSKIQAALNNQGFYFPRLIFDLFLVNFSQHWTPIRGLHIQERVNRECRRKPVR